MTNLETIYSLAKEYAASHGELRDEMLELGGELDATKRKHLPTIKRKAARVAEHKVRLLSAIGEHPELFKRPRTLICHGLRIGIRKGKGRLSWSSADFVVKLIRRHFASQADTLIKTSEAPIKSALARLPAKDLKRLGVDVGDSSDQPVAEPADGEIEKLVDALIKDREEGS